MVPPARAPAHGQQRLHGALARHAGEGDVVEGDRLVGSVREHRRAVLVKALVSRRSRAASISCGSISMRKSRWPRFTPRTGTGGARRVAGRPSIVPSPPRLMSASASSTSCSALTGSMPAGSRAACRSSAMTRLSCERAQRSSFSATGVGSVRGCRTSPSRPVELSAGMRAIVACRGSAEIPVALRTRGRHGCEDGGAARRCAGRTE